MKYKALFTVLLTSFSFSFTAEKTGKLLDYMIEVKNTLENAKNNAIKNEEFTPEPFVSLADDLIKNKQRMNGLNNFALNPLNQTLEIYDSYIANNPGLESIIKSFHKGYRLYVIPKSTKEKNIRERAVIFFIYLFIETQLLPKFIAPELSVAQAGNDQSVAEEQISSPEIMNSDTKIAITEPQQEQKTNYSSKLNQYLNYLRNYFSR